MVVFYLSFLLIAGSLSILVNYQRIILAVGRREISKMWLYIFGIVAIIAIIGIVAVVMITFKRVSN